MKFPISNLHDLSRASSDDLRWFLSMAQLRPTMVMAISSPTEILKKAKHVGRIADSYWSRSAQVNHHANPYGIPQKPLPEAGSVQGMRFEPELTKAIPENVLNHFIFGTVLFCLKMLYPRISMNSMDLNLVSQLNWQCIRGLPFSPQNCTAQVDSNLQCLPSIWVLRKPAAFHGFSQKGCHNALDATVMAWTWKE